jgi:hypothetical protein
VIVRCNWLMNGVGPAFWLVTVTTAPLLLDGLALEE